jgi:L-ascorbate metabolism protein UlaG (beta-lactamase superfamily)
MRPQDAARACQWMGVSQAVPVHFARNALVRGTGASEDFRSALASSTPGVTANIMKTRRHATDPNLTKPRITRERRIV